MPLTPINPDSLARPRGYSHGMRGEGEMLFVAGQIGWNREGRMVSSDLVEQFAAPDREMVGKFVDELVSRSILVRAGDQPQPDSVESGLGATRTCAPAGTGAVSR